MRDVTLVRRGALVALLVAALGSMPGRATTKGPDGGGYRATDQQVYSFVDVAGGSGGASVLADIDDGLAPLTLPFSFTFYNVAYSTICVSTNGAIYFVPTAGECGGFVDFANTDLTSTVTPNDYPAVFPFWSDLAFQSGDGAIVYQTLGTPGSRRFVVQWNNAYPADSPNPVTFQAILSEGSNKLLFQYRTVALGAGNRATNGARATVGIRNTGAPANNAELAWSFNAPVITDSQALLFSSDVDGPTITIASPIQKIYTVGESVQASYGCTDSGSGVASCVGTIPSGSNLDTSSVGTATFFVSATDQAGNPSTSLVNYTVSYGGLFTATGPARAWLGLNNGTNFDVRVEVLKNGAAVATLQADGLTGGSGNFDNAILRAIGSAVATSTTFAPGDTLGVRLSIRIGSNPSSNRNGMARLWYNSAAANSRIETIINGVSRSFYLGSGFALRTAAGTGPQSSIDVLVDGNVNNNAFQPFGTWNLTF